MKVLTHIHAYPPEHNAGAEWMLHDTLKELVKRGHQCHVLTTTDANYEFDGVQVFRDDFDNCNREWTWCDVGLTHLVRAGKAWNWHNQTGKPIVYVVHNTFTNRLVEVKQDFSIIYNTDWAREDGLAKGYKHNNTVLHPPVWLKDYECKAKKRRYITLINCWDRKGGQVLIDLAKNNPQIEFLGVKGGYGEQLTADFTNLKYIENTPNIREVYEQTCIILMPSVYESYGRVAVEAMCAGIPVIASRTPGLVESLGDCGMFVDEVSDAKDLNYKAFEQYIYQLNDNATYNEISLKGKNRAKALDLRNVTEMDNLVQWLQKLN